MKKRFEPVGMKKRKTAILAAAVLGTAVVIYGGLCIAGSRGDSFRRNTIVNGIVLENMNKEQALAALTDAFSGETILDGKSYAAIQVTPDIPDFKTSYDLDLSKALVWDFTDTLESVYEAQRGGNILLQGIHLIKGGASCQVLPYVRDDQPLYDAIEAAGILELDTSVAGNCEVGEDKLILTKGKDGYAVDGEALIAMIVENTAAGNYEPICCKAVTTTGLGVDLQEVYDRIHAEKVDPTIRVAEDRSYEVVEAVRGVFFDVADAENSVEKAESGTSWEYPLVITEPTMTTEEFTECLFRDELGSYTTSVGGSYARRSNVRLAAEKCDGYILLPGEEFAYNAVVGKRTAEAGFQAAPAYQNGETVNELGGGVCQVSSTLYCACMYANLKITLRRNHTYVSSYVPMGMDATVSWGGPDYKFVNDTDFPILIRSYYENDRLNFKIFGTDVNHYKVEITSHTLAVIDPPVKRVEDGDLWEGETAVKSSGHTGYKAQTYRHIYDEDGNLVWEGEEAYSHYSTSDKIILVGTKKKPEPEPEPQPEPEQPAKQGGSEDGE